jgi:hypothetical protein
MSGLELAGALLVAGSYEHCLFGLDAGASAAPALSKVFTVEAHNGAVKSLASAGGFIASMVSATIKIFRSTPAPDRPETGGGRRPRSPALFDC